MRVMELSEELAYWVTERRRAVERLDVATKNIERAQQRLDEEFSKDDT